MYNVEVSGAIDSNPAAATRIGADSHDRVLFVDVNDLDRFVLTQREAFQAAREKQIADDFRDRLVEQAFSMMAKIRAWCRRHDVGECWVAPRPEDLLFVVVSKDDDPLGSLQEAMAQLDLSLFKDNQWRVHWMLLRKSEAPALSAFVDENDARRVFHADQP